MPAVYACNLNLFMKFLFEGGAFFSRRRKIKKEMFSKDKWGGRGKKCVVGRGDVEN